MFVFDKALASIQIKKPLRFNVFNFEDLIALLQKLYSLNTKKQISKKAVNEKISNAGKIKLSGLTSDYLIDIMDDLALSNFIIFDLETRDIYESITGDKSKVFLTLWPEKFYGKLQIFANVHEVWRIQKQAREVILHIKKLEENLRKSSDSLSSRGTLSLYSFDLPIIKNFK